MTPDPGPAALAERDHFICTVCGDRCVLRKTDPPPRCYAPLRRQQIRQEQHDR